VIRAVLDTNVLISAFFWPGAPRRILDAAAADQFRLLTSEALLTELEDVLSRDKFVPYLKAADETVTTLLEDFRVIVEVVDPAGINAVLETDPDDDAVLACALGGRAAIIVSGDAHLLNKAEYHGILIMNVNKFIEML
jgi:putative PIN family toxin of toxin-antitoxin system